jgi:hypothetical protein
MPTIPKFWLEYLNGRYPVEVLGVGGRIILEWILGKQGGKVWTAFIWLRIGTDGGSCEYGNEPLVSMKGTEFLD